MKILLITISLQMLYSSLSFAQTNKTINNPQNYADSIALAKAMISELDIDKVESFLSDYRGQNESQAAHITNDVMELLQQRHTYLLSRLLFNSRISIPENAVLSNYNDTIQLAKTLIDNLGDSEFKIILERYRYLNFKQHHLVNQELLLLLEEKLKTITDEN